ANRKIPTWLIRLSRANSASERAGPPSHPYRCFKNFPASAETRSVAPRSRRSGSKTACHFATLRVQSGIANPAGIIAVARLGAAAGRRGAAVEHADRPREPDPDAASGHDPPPLPPPSPRPLAFPPFKKSHPPRPPGPPPPPPHRRRRQDRTNRKSTTQNPRPRT